MSGAFVNQGLVDLIAQSIDITKLSSEAAKALAPDVEYKLRELIQDAQKFSRHAGRLKLTTEDVNNALRMRNTEPLYGFSNKDPAKYVKAVGHSDVYCLEDPEMPVDQLIERPLPRAPVEVGLMPHWLFINGVQPLTPENTPMEKPPAKRARQPAAVAAAATAAAAANGQAAGGSKAGAAQGPASGAHDDGRGVQVQLPVQHVLSLELQSYFTRAMAVIHAAVATAKAPAPPTLPPTPAAATAAAAPSQAQQGPGQQQHQHWGQLDDTRAAAAAAAVVAAAAAPAAAANGSAGQPDMAAQPAVPSAAQDVKLEAVLGSMSTDPGLHPLVPYLIKYIADEVSSSLPHAPALMLLLRLAQALLRNEDLRLRDYVHQLLPALLTCVVAKGIGCASASQPVATDAWAVRQAAAQVVAEVCARFGDVALNVQPRVTRTLLLALLDTSKPLTTHYGAVVGLAALGPAAVRLLLLPQLPAYLDRLQPLINGDSTQESVASMMDVDGVVTSRNGHGADGNGSANGPAGAGSGEIDTAAVTNTLKVARRADATRVHGALVDAAAGALYRLMVDRVAAGVEAAGDQAATAAARTSATALAKVAEAFRPQTPGVDTDVHMTGPDADNDKARACAVLAMSWREDVSLPDVAWAAGELLGPALVARLPQARPAHESL